MNTKLFVVVSLQTKMEPIVHLPEAGNKSDMVLTMSLWTIPGTHVKFLIFDAKDNVIVAVSTLVERGGLESPLFA